MNRPGRIGRVTLRPMSLFESLAVRDLRVSEWCSDGLPAIKLLGAIFVCMQPRYMIIGPIGRP